MTARSLAVMILAVLAGQPPTVPSPPAVSAPARPQESGSSAPAADAKVKTASKGAQAAPADSAAEQINRLQNSIAAEEKHLERLKAERDDPAGEYAQAKAAFEEADQSLQSKKKALDAMPPGDLAGRRDLGAQVAEQEKLRNLAKNRFDLAIETRKAIGQQIANLEQMLARDRKDARPAPGRGPDPGGPDRG